MPIASTSSATMSWFFEARTSRTLASGRSWERLVMWGLYRHLPFHLSLSSTVLYVKHWASAQRSRIHGALQRAWGEKRKGGGEGGGRRGSKGGERKKRTCCPPLATSTTTLYRHPPTVSNPNLLGVLIIPVSRSVYHFIVRTKLSERCLESMPH